jgi:hypothetical protein
MKTLFYFIVVLFLFVNYANGGEDEYYGCGGYHWVNGIKVAGCSTIFDYGGGDYECEVVSMTKYYQNIDYILAEMWVFKDDDQIYYGSCYCNDCCVRVKSKFFEGLGSCWLEVSGNHEFEDDEDEVSFSSYVSHHF